jgi:hypothetical protein
MVEAERAGPEQLHHKRPRGLRRSEDEALGHADADVLHFAGHRVGERRERHVEMTGNAEGAAPTVDRDLDGCEDRIVEGRHRAPEQLEGSVALRPSRENAHQRLALLAGGAVRDVEPERAAALVNRVGPRGGVDHIETVESRLSEAALLDVVGDERLAVAVGRVAAEVAGAAEIAVAGLHVVDLQLPGRDLVGGRCGGRSGFPSWHRTLLRVLVVTGLARTRRL